MLKKKLAGVLMPASKQIKRATFYFEKNESATSILQLTISFV
jgi:hypothetical protein